MAETISPETGLPVGAQPTPAGAYDFSGAHQSMQGLLEKLGQGQANLAERRQKDKIAWENAMMDFPDGDYIQGDENWIQEAVDSYNELAVKYKEAGLNLKDLPTKERSELKKLEKEANNRAAKAKKNMEYVTTTQKTIEYDNGDKFDQKYGGDYINRYINQLTPEQRVEARQKVDQENSPYQKNSTPIDVINRATKTVGQDSHEEGGERKWYYDVDKIIKTIEEDTLSGPGKRMYEQNRASDDETPREYAIRMGKLAEEVLKAQSVKVKAGRGRVTSAGVYVTPDKMDVSGMDSTGKQGVFTDPGKNINALRLKGARAGMAPEISIPDVKNPGTRMKMKPTHITVDANGNYWVHGPATNVTGTESLNFAYMLTEDDIGQINYQYDMDMKALLQQAEQDAWDQFAE